MKTTLIQILMVSNLFRNLTTKHYTNFSLSYKIAKAAKEIDNNRNFYAEEERKLVDLYAKKDEKGQPVIEGNRVAFDADKPENQRKFQKEIVKLQQTEVDIFEKLVISLKDFKDGEMDLTPNDILALEPFVEFIDDDNDEQTHEAA